MTRIEKNAKIEEQVKNLTSQVKETEKLETKEHKKSHQGKFFGCGLILMIFLAFIAWIIWFLAASGLANIPWVSSLVYKIPTPLHEVSPGVLAEAYVSDYFNSLITERLQTGGGELTDRNVSLILSEADITATLRNFLASGELSFFESDRAQIATEKETGAEIFIPLANTNNENALRLLLKPVVESGQPSLAFLKISIGNFNLPLWLSDLVLKPLANWGLEAAKQKFASYSTLDRLELEDGQIKITGSLTVQVEILK